MKSKRLAGYLLLGILALVLFLAVSGYGFPKTFTGRVVAVGGEYFTLQSTEEGSRVQAVVLSWPDTPVAEGDVVTVKYHRSRNSAPVGLYADEVIPVDQ